MKKVFSMLLAVVMLFALVVPTLAAYTSSNDDYTVYVTPSGKKYHRQSCPTLANSKTVIAMSRSEAIASGRTACKDCKPDSGNTTPAPNPTPAPVVTPDPAPVVRTNPVAGFVDVDSSDWFANAVQYANDAGLMNGVGDNRFDPYGAVTRAMVATVLYREAGQPSVEGMKCDFTDLRDDWYKNAGVTNGTDATHFSPTQSITREQMASMIMRYALSSADGTALLAELQQKDPNGTVVAQLLSQGVPSELAAGLPGAAGFKGFPDAASISDYARWNVLFCRLLGVMKGDEAGTFRPQATLSRAECAQTFLNISEIDASILAR